MAKKTLDLKEREAIHSVFHRLERRWETTPKSDGIHHDYDPLPFWEFFHGLSSAEALARGRRLLDIGCGIGRNAALAHHLGWQVSGIDRNAEYIAVAKEFLPEGNFAVVDAFCVEYFDCDLLYMYRPMKSDEDEQILEEHVLSRLRSGTVVFLPMRSRNGNEVWVM